MKSASESLASCLDLLRGPSDEHKFAGLVLITKLQPREGNVMRDVMDAVGHNFIRRLLRTNVEGGGGMYQSIAVGVLAAACRDPSIAKEASVHCQDLLALLQTTESLQVLADCMFCMCEISSNEQGRASLCQMGAPTIIAARLTKHAAVHSTTPPPPPEANGDKVSEAPPIPSVDNKSNTEPDPAELFESHGVLCLERCIGPSEDMRVCLGEDGVASLSKCLATCSPRLALPCLRLLLLWTERQRRGAVAGSTTSQHSIPFASPMREGLLRCLRTAVNEPLRDAALCLLAALLDRLGGAWALDHGDKATQPSGGFIRVAVRISAAETRLVLDEALAAVTEEELSGADEARLQRALRIVPVSLSVLESTVRFLCSDETDDRSSWSVLPSAALFDIKAALDDAFAAVLSFANEASDAVKSLLRLDVRAEAVRSLLRSIVAPLGSWLAEDPAALRDQFVTALPALLTLCDEREDGGERGYALAVLSRALVALGEDNITVEAAVDAGVPVRAVNLLDDIARKASRRQLTEGEVITARWMCALLAAILSLAAHLPCHDVPHIALGTMIGEENRLASPSPSEPQYAVGSHPAITTRLPHLLTVLCTSATRSDESRLLLAFASLTLLRIAILQSKDSDAARTAASMTSDINIWENFAQKVLEAVKTSDEGSQEEAFTWQSAAEFARPMLEGGDNAYVVYGVVRPLLLQSVLQW